MEDEKVMIENANAIAASIRVWAVPTTCSIFRSGQTQRTRRPAVITVSYVLLCLASFSLFSTEGKKPVRHPLAGPAVLTQ